MCMRDRPTLVKQIGVVGVAVDGPKESIVIITPRNYPSTTHTGVHVYLHVYVRTCVRTRVVLEYTYVYYNLTQRTPRHKALTCRSTSLAFR